MTTQLSTPKPTQRSALRRIALITSLLGGGGAERMVVTLANGWAARGLEVMIFVLRDLPAVEEYEIDPMVQVRRLNLIKERNPVGSFENLRRLGVIRSEIVQFEPQVIVSFGDKLNVATIFALAGSGIPVISTEHLPPWLTRLELTWLALRHYAYQGNACVVPTRAIARWFLKRGITRVVRLPYPSRRISGRTLRKQNFILSAGRLVHQKGFDLLLRAFSQIAHKHPEWNLTIAGEGPLRSQLEDMRAHLGLEGRVSMPGHVREIDNLLMSAPLFVLSSRYEAYPMILCEAMQAGCTILAFDCPTGPREILGPSSSALIPRGNVDALAERMSACIDSCKSGDLPVSTSSSPWHEADFALDVWTNWIETKIGHLVL